MSIGYLPFAQTGGLGGPVNIGVPFSIFGLVGEKRCSEHGQLPAGVDATNALLGFQHACRGPA